MAPGKVQVDDGIGNVAMPEQDLDGTQIGAGLQHVRRETVAQRVRSDVLLDPCPFSGFNNGVPYHLGRDRHLRSPTVHQA